MDASRRPFPRTHLQAAVIAGLMLVASTGAVRAQYVFDDEILPPRVITWRLAENGFSGLSRPRFDGRAYVVEAVAPNGVRVRLFVDAREGDIVGRQRLDAPLYAPPVRVARPAAPGYGWTEEDADSARLGRRAERLVPPADIPFPGGRAASPLPNARIAPAYPEALRRAELPAQPGMSDGNPLGVNPDTRRKADASKKSAKLVPPAKPAIPRIGPDAPVSNAGTKAAPTSPAPVAAREEPKTAAPPVPKADTPTPASVQPPSEAKSTDTRVVDTEKKSESWKDPSPEKRPVRVIGGATVVPGAEPKGEATHTE